MPYADASALAAAIEVEHAIPLDPEAEALGGGELLAELMKEQWGAVAVVGGSAEHRRYVARTLGKYVAHLRTVEVFGNDVVSGMRSALRMDPDVIIAGPIDEAAAELTQNAALTGHLVIAEMAASPAILELALRGTVFVKADAPLVDKVTRV